MKRCSDCKTEKELACFYRNKSKKDGMAGVCKVCMKVRWVAYSFKNAKRIMEYSRSEVTKNKVIANKERRKASVEGRYFLFDQQLRQTHKITGEDWARLYNSQNGKCEGCQQPLAFGKPTNVDHRHSDGKVRGLLCSSCNIALGYCRELPSVLRGLAKYAEKHNGPEPVCVSGLQYVGTTSASTGFAYVIW